MWEVSEKEKCVEAGASLGNWASGMWEPRGKGRKGRRGSSKVGKAGRRADYMG